MREIGASRACLDTYHHVCARALRSQSEESSSRNALSPLSPHIIQHSTVASDARSDAAYPINSNDASDSLIRGQEPRIPHYPLYVIKGLAFFGEDQTRGRDRYGNVTVGFCGTAFRLEEDGL